MNKKNTFSIEHASPENAFFSPHKVEKSKYEVYLKMYKDSISNLEEFWMNEAKNLDWSKFPTTVLDYSWDDLSQIHHNWFQDGELNISYNCIDRHLKNKGSKTALIWQGQEENHVRFISFNELHIEVCRFANLLKSFGINKGDRVCIYLPMIPELAFAVLACARIGAIHSVVFAGFSAEALFHRIEDSESKLIITANGFYRGSKQILLKSIVDQAIERSNYIENVIVVKHIEEECPMVKGRDVWLQDSIKNISEECPPTSLNSEDPLFILYTSGSTGQPKGIMHTQAGYLLHASLSHKYIFDIKSEDIYWCTADIGWITGHSYVIYGPLANGCTTVMFEGIPTYPDPGRFWEIIEKFKVSIFYTAPTVIRTLISHGDSWHNKYDLNSLRLLGTVGEPINPETWIWYYKQIGKERCHIADTWWQTETGGILISPIVGCSTLKPGCASHPFFGVEPLILKEDGTKCCQNEGGNLCIKKPWPGIMKTIWKDHNKFVETYFSKFKGVYFTGDGCYKDIDGEYWLMGRVDDVVNISGHRLGTAEIESALVSHPNVAEAAVVPVADLIKGQGVYAFVTLIAHEKIHRNLEKELSDCVKNAIGAIAIPNKIHVTSGLPKTRSGKIMRRILRKIVEKDYDNLGDTSTLADPSIVQKIIKEINNSG